MVCHCYFQVEPFSHAVRLQQEAGPGSGVICGPAVGRGDRPMVQRARQVSVRLHQPLSDQQEGLPRPCTLTSEGHKEAV